MNGALRQSKSKRSNYTKVGKCRLSAGRHLPRSYPGMDSSTGEGLSRVTPWHSSCRVEISLTIHQNWFCKRDCPWMLRDNIWLVLYFFDNILLVYIQLRQQSLPPHFYLPVLPIHNCYSATLYLWWHNWHKNSTMNTLAAAHFFLILLTGVINMCGSPRQLSYCHGNCWNSWGKVTHI